jgi:sulfur-carrier protein adenylyltransferase/sulfurtransferase
MELILFKMLLDAEKRRYRQHLLLSQIGEEGQLKLKNSSVLVIGAGGLGTSVLQYLTAAGLGKIGIVDYETVNESNIHRQILYGDQDFGKLKTIIACQKLEKLNSYSRHEIINLKLNEDNALAITSGYSIIVDCTNDSHNHTLINQVCINTGKPWVYGSVNAFEGQISVFNYENGPSLKDFSPYDMNDFENTAYPEPGLFCILPGIIGAMQATEVIKIITGMGKVSSGKILNYNLYDYSLNTNTLLESQIN